MLAQLIKSDSPDLIGKIYDCAAKTENWPDALRSISIALDFDCCAISEVNAFPRTVRITHCHGIDPDFRHDLEENSLFNPVAHRRVSPSPREPWSASQLFGAALLRSSPFYKKALAPREIDDVLLQILTNSSSGFSIFIAMRRKRGGGIQPADFRDVGAIASHIRRAYELSHLVGRLERQRDSLSDAFDVLSTGLILIDEDGHMAHANHAASQLLDEATAVVRRSRDQISACDPNAAKELRDAITAARRAAGPTSQVRSSILLPGVEGRDLIAWITPVASNLRGEVGSHANARVAIFLKHIDDSLAPPDNAFVRHYNLTERETRALALLMRGMTLNEIAEFCTVSYNTMRTHLRNLFRKTGTARQAELLNMASTSLSPIHRADPPREAGSGGPLATYVSRS